MILHAIITTKCVDPKCVRAKCFPLSPFSPLPAGSKVSLLATRCHALHQTACNPSASSSASTYPKGCGRGAEWVRKGCGRGDGELLAEWGEALRVALVAADVDPELDLNWTGALRGYLEPWDRGPDQQPIPIADSETRADVTYCASHKYLLLRCVWPRGS